MPYKDPSRQRKHKREAARSTVAKLAVQVQNAAELPEPPTYDELMRVLGAEARNGHVPAIRILLEEYRRNDDSNQGEGSSLAVVHDLQANG